RLRLWLLVDDRDRAEVTVDGDRGAVRDQVHRVGQLHGRHTVLPGQTRGMGQHAAGLGDDRAGHDEYRGPSGVGRVRHQVLTLVDLADVVDQAHDARGAGADAAAGGETLVDAGCLLARRVIEIDHAVALQVLRRPRRLVHDAIDVLGAGG